MRNCKTCGNRDVDLCYLSGFHVKTERRYPTHCGKDFNGWIPKPPKPHKLGIRKRLHAIWYGE